MIKLIKSLANIGDKSLINKQEEISIFSMNQYLIVGNCLSVNLGFVKLMLTNGLLIERVVGLGFSLFRLLLLLLLLMLLGKFGFLNAELLKVLISVI